MKEVILKPLEHRGQECIGIFFDINFTIQGALQKTKLVKFSATHKCWYTLLNKENYNTIFRALKGVAAIEQNALHQYLADKKKKIAETNKSSALTKVVPVTTIAKPVAANSGLKKSR